MKGGQGKILKKVYSYLRKYRILLIFSLILAAIIVALTLYVPILVGHAIDHIVYGVTDFGKIYAILWRILTVVSLTAAAQWIMSVIHNKVAYEVVRDIRNAAFEQIEVLPLKYLDSRSYGEMVSRILTDTDQFADGLLMGFTQFFSGIATIFGTLLFMFLIHPRIALVVVMVTPLSLLTANFIARKTFSMFRQQSETRGEQTGFVDEMIKNIKVVKAYGHEEAAMREFEEINSRLFHTSLKATFYSSLTNPVTRFINGVVYTLVALTGALAVLNGKMSVGILTSFLSYANQYTKPFNEISSVITELQNAMACAARVFELIEEEAQTPDALDAAVLYDATGKIDCERVSFSYSPDKPLIRNFNLHVRPGQNIAIVGPTGCGKTTIINLLMRFYDVDSGRIAVDEKDIRNITRHSLRSSYGMVLQDTWLKQGTIRENIVMGKPEATIEEIIKAAKASHADSFIKRLPQGYDTIIGEDGGILSQGQKQLLCITRIMLCLPPMLILDEATSSIDTRTEMRIQNAFHKMMVGRTSFIVAHRLSTIRNADIILVMKDGNIIEQGNHEELIAQKGFYYQLYQS